MLFQLKSLALLVLALSLHDLAAQTLRGKVIDSDTREPLPGASVNSGSTGCQTNNRGEFILNAPPLTTITISSVGYNSVTTLIKDSEQVFELKQINSLLQGVVLSANREGTKRSLAPLAINSITASMIQDAKPQTLDHILNKISGVYMVNLGNEQHSMSIRQPMTTKSLFLYLEDGIPIRTTGLFNHNALLEINQASIKNIEVIKGPSSSLYGSEAVGGVVNFITLSPPPVPLAKLSLQANNIGYKKMEGQMGYSKGKWGFNVSGSYAQKHNGFIDYSDYYKSGLTARLDYKFSQQTNLSNSFSILDYSSDMSGSIDSTGFINRSFNSFHTFTYRKVRAVRYRSTIIQVWNDKSKTTGTVVYRNNKISQNPAYSIKDDYRRMPNGSWSGNKELAHGEINKSFFNSYVIILQHRQQLSWMNAAIIGGASIDISPSGYLAQYILVRKDSLTKKYLDFTPFDSLLTHYNNAVTNYAGFLNLEFNPFQRLRLVASLRYDLFRFQFDNYLTPSSFSGSPDTINNFNAISPKIGFTYNFSKRLGIYANYSQGFVPPQVTEMYRGVKVPDLEPSLFYNYEIGGWSEIIKDRLSADLSAYRLEGTNEIISVKTDDGSTQNMNSGKTSHTGIELGFNAKPLKSISIRFSAAISRHEFTEFVEKGVSYNGNEMSGAPRWLHNAELWYQPTWMKGLRVGMEWQKVGSYFMDPKNTVKYKGYNIMHFRIGYRVNALEVWVNVMNAADKYYAYTSSKSNYGYNYTPAEPRHINFGIAYDFGHFLNPEK